MARDRPTSRPGAPSSPSRREWLGGRSPLPIHIDEMGPVTPEIFMWYELHTQQVVWFQIADPRDRPARLRQVVLRRDRAAALGLAAAPDAHPGGRPGARRRAARAGERHHRHPRGADPGTRPGGRAASGGARRRGPQLSQQRPRAARDGEPPLRVRRLPVSDRTVEDAGRRSGAATRHPCAGRRRSLCIGDRRPGGEPGVHRLPRSAGILGLRRPRRPPAAPGPSGPRELLSCA